MKAFVSSLTSGAASRHFLACTCGTSGIFALLLLVPASAQRFAPITVYPSGGSPQYTAVADVNRDGKLDIIASNVNGVISVMLGNGDNSFQAPKTVATLPAGTYPILSADFNRDGKADLALLDTKNSRVLVYLGHGDGSFASPQSEATPPAPQYMVAGDVNGDGKEDLVVSMAPSSNGQLGELAVFLGKGNGAFETPLVTQTGPVGAMALGDVNHDGRLDLAVVTDDPNAVGNGSVSVLLGNGDGTFGGGSSISTLPGNSQVALADLSGNGNLDLISASLGYEQLNGVLNVWRGNGDGTFGSGQSFRPSNQAGWISVADMNGDGKLDLVVANSFSNSVTVLLNEGGGTLVLPPNNYATALLQTDGYTPTPGLLSVADFSNNGKPSVALATTTGVNVLANFGNGWLNAPQSIEIYAGTGPIFATDFDHDGNLDLGFNTYGVPPCPCPEPGALFGHGDGTFTRASIGYNGQYSAGPIAIGDFNGDGFLDLAGFGVTSSSAPGFYIADYLGSHSFASGQVFQIPNTSPYLAAGDFNHDGFSDMAVLDGNDVDIYLNNHSGSFTGPVSYHVGSNPDFIVQRDVNGDGKADLMVANHDSNDVSVLLGHGDGTFAPAVNYNAGSHPNVITLADFNRDGKLDLAVGGDEAAILLGRGDGTFGQPTSYPAHGPVVSLVYADLRGNGIEDLLATSPDITAKTTPLDFYVLYGKGDGSFAAPVAYAAGVNPAWLTVGDFNGDGAQDIVVSTFSALSGPVYPIFSSSGLTLLLNPGGTYISLKSATGTVKAGQAVTFTATLVASVPGSGQPTGTIAFKDGPRGFGFVHVANGKATFTTSKLSKGTHTITASYWGNGVFQPHISAPITVKVE